MLPRIFIGGTGRSGTTILYKALGCHVSVHSLPAEMRFIVDPDGLINLIDALSVKYSPVQAREALFRFERLMHEDLTSPEKAPFLGYDIIQWFGEETYCKALDKFCSQLVMAEYSVPLEQQPAPYNGPRVDMFVKRVQTLGQQLLHTTPIPHRTSFNWPRSTVKTVRYFPDRSQLVRLAAEFIDDLFISTAAAHGKETWCEKTPQNLFYLDFLWELFPQSAFVHMKRDPRGVAHSVINQAWGPNNVEDTCVYLQGMYDRWFDVKAQLDLDNHRYLEIKLEELATSTEDVLSQLALTCDLEDHFEDIPIITLDRVNYWRTTMCTRDIDRINELMEPYILAMGYEI